MAQRFGSSGINKGFSSRERLFYVGSALVTFAAAAIVIAVVYNYDDADAVEKPVPREELPQQVTFGTVTLLAPAAPISAGVKLSQAQLKEIYWPRNEVPEGAIRRAEDIKDMYAKMELQPNQPILRDNLSPAPMLGGLPDLIPAGHRATTIEVDATSGVEGWALPGAHVDILVTYLDSSDGQKKSQIAVEDAVVLSFNGSTNRNMGSSDGVGRMDRATVTVAVPVLEAVKIHTAVAMGRISLILRNPGDLRSVSNLSVSNVDFKGAENKAHTKKVSKEEPTGFVRFSGKGGDVRQLELRNNKWFKVGEGGEE